jgi:hypothetical protein
MAGVKSLRKVQLGRETTAGTAVAATTYWRGTGTMQDNRETVFAEEDVGYLSGIDRTFVPKYEAEIELEGVATYEQLPHILDAAIGEATPAADGTGSGYVYTYTFPTTAGGTLQTYTIEGGDNEGAEEMEYAYVEKFTLSGAPGEAVQSTATWKGRQVTVASFTTTATIPTVESILFQKSLLYIDTAGGAFGGTLKSNTLIGFNLDYTTGWQAVFAGDGQLYFSFIKNAGPEALLEVTFEHDATSIAEQSAWRAETPRRLQVKIRRGADHGKHLHRKDADYQRCREVGELRQDRRAGRQRYCNRYTARALHRDRLRVRLDYRSQRSERAAMTDTPGFDDIEYEEGAAPTVVRIRVSDKRITLADIIKQQSKNASNEVRVELIARFVINEDGRYLTRCIKTRDGGYRFEGLQPVMDMLTEKCSIDQIDDIASKVVDGLNGIRNSAVPLSSSGS